MKLALAAVLFFTACQTLGPPAVKLAACPPVREDPFSIEDQMRSVVFVDVNYKVKVTEGAFEGLEIGSGKNGTGFVVAVDFERERSLVATAGHVAADVGEIPTKFGKGVVDPKDFKIAVLTVDGRRCDAARVYVDEANDLGFLDVFCLVGRPVSIATGVPPPGSQIQMIGAPRGYHQRGFFYVGDGRFLGIDDESSAGEGSLFAFSVRGSFGMSGSPVFYRGRVFSVALRISATFDQLSFGAPYERLRESLEVGKKAWLQG